MTRIITQYSRVSCCTLYEVTQEVTIPVAQVDVKVRARNFRVVQVHTSITCTSIPGRCWKGSLSGAAAVTEAVQVDEASAALSVEVRPPTVSAVDAAPPRTPRVVEYTRAQLGRLPLLLLLPDAVEALDKSRPMSPTPPLIALLAIILAERVTCTRLADVAHHCCAPNGCLYSALLCVAHRTLVASCDPEPPGRVRWTADPDRRLGVIKEYDTSNSRRSAGVRGTVVHLRTPRRPVLCTVSLRLLAGHLSVL